MALIKKNDLTAFYNKNNKLQLNHSKISNNTITLHKLMNDINHLNNKLVIKSLKKKINKSLNKKTINKKTINKKTINKKTHKNYNKMGGFIRAGSTQHFYSPCKTNTILLNKEGQNFTQQMNQFNESQKGKQPNIYSVNDRNIYNASDTARSRYH